MTPYHYSGRFRADTQKDYRDLLLKEVQWVLAKDLVDILQEFEVATTIVSGQKYVTLSLMLPVVSDLA